MYIEETGEGDGDITVTVGGQEYTTEANYDLDGDGVDDSAKVMTDHGSILYLDENGDGHADVMQTLDDHDTVMSQSRFNPASGDWVVEPPHQPDHPHEPAGRSLIVDTPMGDQQVGPPTEDTNDDGTPDTAIVQTANGTMMVTDRDGDGSADQIVELTSNGDVTVSQHTGHGQWVVVERGRMTGGEYAPDRPAPMVGTDDATWALDEPLAQPCATTPSDEDWR